jgi:LPXTG-site transpeptidase (sortase) family protein
MNLNSTQKNYVLIGGLTLGIFTLTYTALILLGLTPRQLSAPDVIVAEDENIFQIVGDAAFEEVDKNVIPQKVEIPKIGISTTVYVPQSVDVATLDATLSKGAVYYPGSGTLQGGNMFLFGHSTNWAVVNNQAYKTFNDLEKLVRGDQIQITSGDSTYIYKVTSVRRASEDDVLVEFNKGSRMLTISTCDTFGRKQDRWVVEAEFDKIL